LVDDSALYKFTFIIIIIIIIIQCGVSPSLRRLIHYKPINSS